MLKIYSTHRLTIGIAIAQSQRFSNLLAKLGKKIKNQIFKNIKNTKQIKRVKEKQQQQKKTAKLDVYV